MSNVAELEAALNFPWDKWTVFLHPEQRQWVERDYTGPARVSGSAGTGKTIVALHRAAYLARQNPDCRVLLTTFSDTLASALHTKLKRLVGSEPRLAERIDVLSLNAVGLRLTKAQQGPIKLASRAAVREADRRRIQSRGRPQIQPALSGDRVGTDRRCMATGKLGGLPRCLPPGPQDAAARAATGVCCGPFLNKRVRRWQRRSW
ncbi:MAG: UvrD-helicase domain-containing protein [Giesbergeria sp.]